ncbi:MAG: methyltransferase domain-containing protein [Planctomycetes bacterium]|nr:methyltransferase domain-containing protein [Planctomycetota bacterium]
MVPKLAAIGCLVILWSGCQSAPVVEDTGVRPANLPADINDKFYEAGVADPWLARWEIESREIYKYRHRIAASIGLGQGFVVADVGCGTGLFEALLSDLVGPLGKVIALDISPKFVKHVTERMKKENIENVEVRQCAADSVGLPTASVDTIFVCDTYHHFEAPAQSLASMMRALRPGGRLVVVDFERIPGVSRPWLLNHVRAPKEVFAQEIIDAGFAFEREVAIDGLDENYMLHFRRP